MENVFEPVIEEISEVYHMCTETLFVDQWLKETAMISFVFKRVIGETCTFWHFQRGKDKKYILKKEENEEIDEEIDYVEVILKSEYSGKKCLTYNRTLRCQQGMELELICICVLPSMIQTCPGKILISNTFFGLMDGLDEWFEALSISGEHNDIKLTRECISNKYNVVSAALEDAANVTCLQLERLYFPLKISYINVLSGEYYEKSECNSTLIFLPLAAGKIIKKRELEFDFQKENIFLIPREMRRIRKLMQIAQKELYLLLEFDKEKSLYKIYGICKKEVVDKIWEKKNIPWAKATIKNHMQWDLSLGNLYIFSYQSGEYKISIKAPDDYLIEKCSSVFGPGISYDRVNRYIQKSCEQSHGTMLVVLDEEEAKKEAKRFARSQYGMLNGKVEKTEEVWDINSFNAIDGSVIIDVNGNVHAIGVILDGAIRSIGNMARGARYNSAIKYRDSLRRRRKAGMILIVSEDGMVEILDTN